jgi:hypothetical protein
MIDEFVSPDYLYVTGGFGADPPMTATGQMQKFGKSTLTSDVGCL